MVAETNCDKAKLFYLPVFFMILVSAVLITLLLNLEPNLKVTANDNITVIFLQHTKSISTFIYID